MTDPVQNETEPIQRAATGDSDAFGVLVQPHLSLFFNGINLNCQMATGWFLS